MKTDAQGNVILEPSAPIAGAKTKTKKRSAGSGTGQKTERKNDYEIAAGVVEEWGKPLAFHGGEMWSFTQAEGWLVVTNQILSLANKRRGMSTEKSVFQIICTQLATPDLSTVSTASTYWERVGGVWGGRWEPFRLNSNQVALSNGILTVHAGGELEFEPTEHRIIFGPRVTIPFDLEHGIDMECPEFERMVEYALPDLAERNYLQELSGLILQPHVLLRGQVVFWGEKHSGKTTLATALACAPAGLVGASFIAEDRIVYDKWAATPLTNKFANVSNDSDFTRKWESWMKQYTSGMFTVEPKFHRPTSMPTTAKLISTCNEFQTLTDESGAAEQRYRVFQFTKAVAETGRSEQTEFMKPEYWCAPERRAGIVGWMLRGLARVVEHGLVEPKSLTLKKKMAIGEANPAYHWLSENLSKKIGAFVTAADIQSAMASDSLAPVTDKVIAALIKRIFGVTAGRCQGRRGYSGLSL